MSCCNDPLQNANFFKVDILDRANERSGRNELPDAPDEGFLLGQLSRDTDSRTAATH